MPSLAVLEDDRIQVTLPNGEVRILEPAKRGRPSRAYDPTVLQMFADGLELPEISHATGIKLGTLRDWLTRGKHNGDEPYRTIYDLYRDTSGYELDDRPPALHTPPLTHELISQITNLLNQGHHLTTAARLLHIHPNTLYGWLQRGKAEFEDPNNTKTYYDVPPYWPLYVEVQEARSKPVATSLQAWMGAIHDGDWRAAKEFLAVRYPDEWAPQTRQRIEIDVEMRQKILAVAAREGLDPTVLEAKVVEMIEQGTKPAAIEQSMLDDDATN